MRPQAFNHIVWRLREDLRATMADCLRRIVKIRVVILILIVCVLVPACDVTPLEQIDSNDNAVSSRRLEADVRFLADDLLEGREAGERGYDLAALYVAERFRSLGLTTGGDDNSFFQMVPMLEYWQKPQGRAVLTLNTSTAALDLVAGQDYFVFPTSAGREINLEAPAVFSGFCFHSRDHDRDDFDGLDLDGKIAVCLRGAPKFLDSEERAHFSSTILQRVSARGAVGVVVLYTQTFEKVFPFEQFEKIVSSGSSQMRWLQADGVPFSLAPNIQAGAILSLAGAKKVFASIGRSWDDILETAEGEIGDVKGFDLGLTARIEVDSLHRRLESANVVGVIRGSDPVLRDEHVILTAHLDGKGFKPTDEENDDEIYNGAMDNAVGVAALLEVARLLNEAPPKRSIVVIALTAEEKGLIGSDYFARNPTMPGESIVATINLDMPILNYDFTDVVAFGAERSTLYEPVFQATQRHGLTLSPDPDPDQGVFTRSDHYNFVKQGVPAIYLKLGNANGGESAKAEFRKMHYHQPSDELRHVNFEALRRFTAVKSEIARNIANMPERPVWKDGDFFGTTFNGPME
jgi:hypothetical protein